MNIILQALLASILRATHTKSEQSQARKCVKLNFQATALQSADSCTLILVVIDGVDILAPDMNHIDATCGFHLENVDYQTCVGEVMEVVAGLTDEGCVVTGG